jgi:hypothetical protein
MFEKPPLEKKGLLKPEGTIAATSGSFTVDPAFIWVAPTDVTYGHVG